MGNRDANEDDDEVARERQRARAFWKDRGRLVRRALRLDDSTFDQRILEIFEGALVNQFWHPVKGILDSMGIKKDAWATRIEVDRTTLYRFPRTMKFRDFVFTLMGFDIDICEVQWPRFERAALEPYVEAFTELQVNVLKAARGERPSIEDALCLYLTARNWSLLEARERGDERACEEECRRIGRHAAMYLGTTTWIAGSGDLRAVIDGRGDAWAVLETVVDYDWIE